MNLKLIVLIFVSLLITSCHTNIKEPQQTDTTTAQQLLDELPVDNRTDEEFLNSTN